MVFGSGRLFLAKEPEIPRKNDRLPPNPRYNCITWYHGTTAQQNLDVTWKLDDFEMLIKLVEKGQESTREVRDLDVDRSILVCMCTESTREVRDLDVDRSMLVCMCTSMIHIHIHIHLHIHIHIHIHIHMYIHIHIYIYNIHMYIHIYIYICVIERERAIKKLPGQKPRCPYMHIDCIAKLCCIMLYDNLYIYKCGTEAVQQRMLD